ncbi:M23 family metallopeptidase [Phytoactinopolyspora halotolerans]|uniref:Peptidoglycan DD-metalloendopeptidase family protein n=1 Tax=Phytoactinopolyspora halotolerans TaxID=1981512 RepID=A0A6L9SF08_9ACTN|nr:peptidoglycan DD-metalloendopeptidase family protein [Phytoactinopolyspora halotolerans]NEE03677.1 peptidoglycan DD-metalloendopeptidase family protein [Phytoactinopolyspora halotolerans]
MISIQSPEESNGFYTQQTQTSGVPPDLEAPARTRWRGSTDRARPTFLARVALRVLAIALAAVTLIAARAPAQWEFPVGAPGGPPDVARGFDPPSKPWLSGHRGVDLRAPQGSEVRAAGPGDVTFAGLLAGRGVVVVQHGTIRMTYEPVDPIVTAGASVSAGDTIGTVAATGSHCAPDSCLHWGAIEGDTYVDPLTLVHSATVEVRLLPLGDRSLTEEPPPHPPDPPASDTSLGWPVADPQVTSPYGMRTHPITGERKLHDGTDFRAACGSPIRASAAGKVTRAADRGAYGLQVTVDHGSLGGAAITTSYSHLSRIGVAVGQRVQAGEVIGWSGTTGLSTGCHLHFMVYVDGTLADPISKLPGNGVATNAKEAHSLSH